MNSRFINKYFIKFKNRIFGEFPKISYSRSGEDLLLDEILNFKMKGFYVDVGAYHPIKYSNTFKFYLRGWNGINVEPNKEAYECFNKIRPNDINLNLAISEKEGINIYYMNDIDPSMNTISKNFSEKALQDFGIKVSEKREIETKRLDNLLLEFNPDNKIIDFLNIDVEGHDLSVLKSNDWNKIRPKVILIELNCGIEQIKEDEVYKFLINTNYTLLSYVFLNPTVGNAFFKNND